MIRISTAESRIMDILWSAGRPLAAEDVVAALEGEADWTDGTVRTFLARLARKKAVATQKDGRRYLYSPLVERARYIQAESQGLLDRLFGGKVAPFVHHFAQQGELSAEEIEQLKALIAEVEKKHG